MTPTNETEVKPIPPELQALIDGIDERTINRKVLEATVRVAYLLGEQAGLKYLDK